MKIYTGQIAFPHQLLGFPAKAVVFGSIPVMPDGKPLLDITTPVKKFSIKAEDDRDAARQLRYYIESIDPSPNRDIVGLDIIEFLRHDYTHQLTED